VNSDPSITRAEQSDQIHAENEQVDYFLQETYTNLGTSFNFDYAVITLYSNRFDLELFADDGDFTVDTQENFIDFYNLTSGYNAVNARLNISPTTSSSCFLATHYFNVDLTEIISYESTTTLNNADDYFRAGGEGIHISTVDIVIPLQPIDWDERTEHVTYRGYIDVDYDRDADSLPSIDINHMLLPVTFPTINGTTLYMQI
jgi:hypothetical protein